MSEVRKVLSEPQRGLFATRDWAAGETVGRYDGELRLISDCAGATDYCVGMRLDGWSGFCVDAAERGNHTRYVDDCRGVSSAPNSTYITEYDSDAKLARVFVFTVKPVRDEEEFLTDYGYQC